MALTRTDTTFSETVQEWVILDNEMQKLQEKIKQIKEKKQSLSTNIMDTLQSRNKLHYTMELPDSQLRVQNRKEYSCLSFQYVEKCLLSLIPDQEQRTFVLKYLKDHREIKEVSELKRLYKTSKK